MRIGVIKDERFWEAYRKKEGVEDDDKENQFEDYDKDDDDKFSSSSLS